MAAEDAALVAARTQEERRADTHRASGVGLDEVAERELGGGRLLSTTVLNTGAYSLSVEPI